MVGDTRVYIFFIRNLSKLHTNFDPVLFVSLLFIITVLLPVQCGSRKTSPGSQSMLLLFLILDVSVREHYSHVYGLHVNIIFSPKSLDCYFGFHVLECHLEKLCSFTALHISANDLE